jgi:hypothetical protein
VATSYHRSRIFLGVAGMVDSIPRPTGYGYHLLHILILVTKSSEGKTEQPSQYLLFPPFRYLAFGLEFETLESIWRWGTYSELENISVALRINNRSLTENTRLTIPTLIT